MAPKRTPKQRLAKYLKRYRKTQKTLKIINFRKTFKSMPRKDYLSDEKFMETLTPHQQKALRTMDVAERQAMLKIDLSRLVSEAREEHLEALEFNRYRAGVLTEAEEASHRTTTEFFEDKNQIDDLTLISLDAAYYLALAQSGVDPRCYVELR
uniref:Uncharacterized protein n=1 Tax=Aedes albopictus TaxID=7160 RepID=A0A023EGY9_AEDAL|nr:uncharacterized protein LOC109406271 [Aedes albopictus]